MSEETKVKKASKSKSDWKAKRVANRKAHYAAQFGLTDRNKKRKLRRHIRGNPGDTQAITRYEKNLGPVAPLGISSKGAKRRRRAMEAMKQVIRKYKPDSIALANTAEQPQSG